MGSAEKVDAAEDYEPGPPPPARGTRAYRRLVLSICTANGFDELNARMKQPWEHIGWRLGIDVITELLYHLTRSTAIHGDPRDAFGNIRMDQFIRPVSDEFRLWFASERSKLAHEDLSPHVAFKAAYAAGEETWGEVERLTPVAARAFTAMEREGNREAAWPILLKYVNRQGERVDDTLRAVSVAHASLRGFAMPPGDGWVEKFLSDEFSGQTGLEGSLAYYAGMTPEMERDHLPGWLATAIDDDDSPPCRCPNHR
ncbi:hypothetical protein [Streptomyces sp. NPDC059278]|uniref:hypothetical protein n=1 Tax=Streptomyces sp. NPDC059278 TaxID=3346801 RepID=UPI003688D406